MIINYVLKMKTSVIISDAQKEWNFPKENYIEKKKIKSILCSPIIHRNKLFGIYYFENNLLSSNFSKQMLETMFLLSSQIATSIQNAILIKQLRNKTEELENKNKELEKIDKMKDIFIATTSHELRTPLNGILTMSNLLSETNLNNEQKDMVKTIINGSETLLILVNRILGYE